VSLRAVVSGSVYVEGVRASETPIFASMITELGQERADALRRVAEVSARLADLEALHEPDADGECPACVAPAPCITLLLARGEISTEQATLGDLVDAGFDYPPGTAPTDVVTMAVHATVVARP